jgi:hypothetical protein
MAKRYPKADTERYFIHRIDPLSIWFTTTGAGKSDNLTYAIRRCKELAEKDKGKNHVVLYRVVDAQRRSDDPVFLSLVNFDAVEHWDMREKETEA